MAFYSSGVEYGIHSLMCMVDSKGDARDMSVREIAELQSVPYDYLAKIFTRLSQAGLVRSIEGRGSIRFSIWRAKCIAKHRMNLLLKCRSGLPREKRSAA